MKLFPTLKQKAHQFLTRPRQIFVEIRGRELVLAEGYCRIEGYTESLITLFSADCGINIKGESLKLRHLSDERIAVEGRISSIELL